MRIELAASLLYALRDRPLGRRTLVQRTGGTESTVRTHLNQLSVRGWVTFAKAGTHLTPEGRDAFAPLFEAVRAVAALTLGELGIDQSQCAAHLRGVQLPTSAWSLRDRAIQAGATGALLLSFAEGLVFPDTQEPLGSVNPASERLLLETFPSLRSKDAVVISFADEPALAAGGLWRMVSELLQLKVFQSQRKGA
ncbi:MAG TPA: DUF4443 domain-containing protein [Candidatus Bipolaricaulota bacterium]